MSSILDTHLQSLSFAGLVVTDVPAVLSTAASGAYASAEIDADVVGAGLANRYSVILDFARSRLILMS